MKNIIWLLWILTLITGCKRVLNCEEKEKLSFEKTGFSGLQLRLGGYYIRDSHWVLFFYRNGIVIDSRIESTNQIEFQNELINGTFYSKISNDKSNWGLFKVSNNEIELEVLNALSQVSCKVPTIYQGKILDDSTIFFLKIKHSNGELIEYRNDTFHFKQFSPKPDSTNSFIN